jgi:hypothetical protein
MRELLGADLLAAAVSFALELRFSNTNLVYEGQETLVWKFGTV